MSFELELKEILGEEGVAVAEPMSRHTTFRIGGPADYYVAPGISEIPQIIELCKLNKIPCTIIGNGSNLLVGDLGIRGLVLEIGKGMQDFGITASDDETALVTVQAGARLTTVAKCVADSGYTGMEFASGIPGNIGGALIMNAGAYGGEMKDLVEEVTVLTKDGEVKVYQAEDYEGGYRSSRPMREGDLILSAILRVEKGDPETIAATMENLKNLRVSKQPLEFPSAGSTFKRPKGYFAGKLIEDSHLSGYRVGDAQVSEKHCGFVINRGNATAADVKQLMEDVSAKVQMQFGVALEPEVRILGEFS